MVYLKGVLHDADFWYCSYPGRILIDLCLSQSQMSLGIFLFVALIFVNDNNW